MTRFNRLRDLLSRDPLRAAAEALAAGDRGRAMELLARGGDWHRAAQLAAEMGEDEKLVRYSLMAAFGRLPEGASLEPLRAAELLASRGRHKEAIPLFERARAYLQAGESALVLRQTLRAARFFKQAGAWMQVVRCYEEAGKLREALHAVEEGILSAERTVGGASGGVDRIKELNMIRADLLLRLGRGDSAAQLLSSMQPSARAAELLERGGRHAEALQLYLDLGLIAEASRLAARSPNRDRLLAQIYLHTGRAIEAGDLLAQLGLAGEAAEAYESAQDWGRAAYRWEAAQEPRRAAEAYEKAGRLADAARCFQAAGMAEKAAQLADGSRGAGRGTRRMKSPPLEVGTPTARKPPAPMTSEEIPLPPPARPPAERAADPADLLVAGSRIAGRYEILAELGRGGMSRVYKARDLELGEIVAIKTLLAPKEGEGSAEETRLLREVQICRRISHPNVVRVYDLGRFAGGLFVTMEHIEGRGLDTVIAKESPLPFARIRSMLAEIAAGLHEAHSQGIVHRDLKPSNVLVTSGRLKILDFGIASMAGLGARLTQTGFVMGSPMYMSPDQILGKELDGRSDLYSLGLLAYTMVAGREPYDLVESRLLIIKQLHELAPDVRRFRPETPAEWADFLGRLLAKAPEDRFQTAQEVVEALAKLPG
jgi:tetratricopeptide (TPR) repeat protein